VGRVAVGHDGERRIVWIGRRLHRYQRRLERSGHGDGHWYGLV